MGKEKSKIITKKEFREQLDKIMPAYKWTVHKTFSTDEYLVATGIQSSGFNRVSTLEVARRHSDTRDEYTARSSGFGKKAPWLAERSGETLARALRDLQTHYEYMASVYAQHGRDLQSGRDTHSDNDGQDHDQYDQNYYPPPCGN